MVFTRSSDASSHGVPTPATSIESPNGKRKTGTGVKKNFSPKKSQKKFPPPVKVAKADAHSDIVTHFKRRKIPVFVPGERECYDS